MELRAALSIEAVAGTWAVAKLAVPYGAIGPVAMLACPAPEFSVRGGTYSVDPHL